MRRMGAAIKQMKERSGPIYEQATTRSRVVNTAWRAAGSPKDPAKLWDKAIRELKIPASERYAVYVVSEPIVENLTFDEAIAVLQRARDANEDPRRAPGDFVLWPINAGPLPAQPAEWTAARIQWYRALGVTAPHPSEDTPERRAWSAWTSERARLRSELH